MLGGILSIWIKYIVDESIRQHKALENQIAYLTEELEKEKVNLTELEKKKTRDNEEEYLKNPKRKVSIGVQLRMLKFVLDVLYKCGYYEKKLMKYLEKGTLRENLNHYDDEAIDFIENYIKEVSEKQKVKRMN